MPSKVLLVTTALLLAALAVCSCGRGSSPDPHASLTLPAPSPTTGAKLTGPNTCNLLPVTMAIAATGGAARRVSGNPSYLGPHIVCEYESSRAVVSLTALQLVQNGRPYTPAQWDTLSQQYHRTKSPLVSVTALASDGYSGWVFGPAQVGSSTRSEFIAECGFVRHGYSFILGGQWAFSVSPPSQATIVQDCEAIATAA